MFAYIFWSFLALVGAVNIVNKSNEKYFKTIKSTSYFVVAHAILLSGSCVMALGLFDLVLSWSNKFVMFTIILLHNSFIAWANYKKLS
ncbi:hypothetical protein [Shewanella livingstonensis]|uniref:Uncharacterized protein n=1 Tax=Shewanella livingstonensis TaxID=150120 RepID=A0A3G8LS93_9GAMM|nr:hypothetical protein [Shewanella livingstonensis]AZG71732.1 hypothetical protein EGC82_02490 [Shewanella livingstonensis]